MKIPYTVLYYKKNTTPFPRWWLRSYFIPSLLIF